MAASFCFFLLTWNASSYYLGIASVWGNCAVLVGMVGCLIWANARLLPAGAYCWANVFLLVTAVFHLGYYVPVKLGVVQALPFMPPVDTEISNVAMTVLAAALISFEAGTLIGSASAKVEGRLAYEKPPMIGTKAVVHTGLIVSVLSALSLFIFIFQLGGMSALLRLSYRDFYDFLSTGDPRFAMTGMWFMPVGLLLTYVGMCSANSSRKQIAVWKIAAGFVFLSQIALGARGGAFLLFLGYLYFRNQLGRKLKASSITVAVIFIALLAPVVAVYRHARAGVQIDAATAAQVTPLAFAIEMGGIYRPFYGFVQLFWKDSVPLLHGGSYTSAARHLLPNLGTAANNNNTAAYYRSNAWITEMIDPISASQNIGLGSSGIAEPYANFGYLGVFLFFCLLGGATGYLEATAVSRRSPIAFAAIAVVFVPLDWYVRDDIFGTIRGLVWPALLLLAIWALYIGFKKRVPVVLDEI